MSMIVKHVMHVTSAGNDPWDNRFEQDYIWPDFDSAKDFRLEEDQFERSESTSLADEFQLEKLNDSKR